MKLIIGLACLLVAVSAVEQLSEDHHTFLFTKWMKQFDKSYERAELVGRFTSFKSNLEAIREHNADYKAGKHTFYLKMNQFGDIANEDFAQQFNGFKPRNQQLLRDLNTLELDVDAPETIDWTTKTGANGDAVVTPVKNQGQCGSCWSFSTTGGLEGACTNAAGASGVGYDGKASCADTSIDTFCGLSEQQLVDCSTAEGNMGCNGGLMDDAFQYIISNKGLTTEKNYPYSATGPNTCETLTTPQPLFCPAKSYKNVPQKSVSQFKKFLAAGPVSVAIQANQFSFQFYGGGVMSGSCGTQLDHGVLAVGYGTLNGAGFWKVKNSWASSWGESGYILLAGNPTSGTSKFNSGAGQCGILMSASAPCMDAECSALTQ
jgi:hypothetical protein